MNDQLQQALLAILNQTVDAVKAGTTFLMAQLPDVIQQLLIWKAVYSGAWFSLWLACSGGLIGLMLYHFKKARLAAAAGRSLAEDSRWAMAMICGAAAFGLFLVNLYSNLTWLQILVAPKIYLIEYAASLIKKGQP